MKIVYRSALLILAISTFACSGGAGEPLEGEEFGEFRSFMPSTRGSSYNTVSVSSVAGNIGCGLSQDIDAAPGIAGDQVFAAFNYNRFDCNSTHPIISSSCKAPEPPTGGGGDDGGDGGDDSDPTIGYFNDCAIYRRWSATGELEAFVYATGGTLTLSPLGPACNLSLDVVFPGGQTFSDSFTLSDGVDCLQ